MSDEESTQKENTLDERCAELIEDCERTGNVRGFVLSMLDKKGDAVRTIEVGERQDLTIPVASGRQHHLDSTDSLLRFAGKYADSENGHPALFINSSGATFIVDDCILIGDRESATVPFVRHPVYDMWDELLNSEITQKQFLQTLRRCESRLDDAEILAQASRLGFTGTIAAENIDADNAGGFMLQVKTKGDERVEKLTKRFRIQIPVWRQDDLIESDDGREPQTIEVNLRPVLPDGGQGPLKFELWSEEFDRLMDQRVEAERAFIDDQLNDTGVLVLAGRPIHAKRRVGALS